MVKIIKYKDDYLYTILIIGHSGEDEILTLNLDELRNLKEELNNWDLSSEHKCYTEVEDREQNEESWSNLLNNKSNKR